MRYTAPRSDIARPTPPDPFRYAGMHMEAVLDPMADRIWKGDALLGWEGDERLQLYLSTSHAKWCLARYCEDKQWRVLIACPATPQNTAIVVGDIITQLIANDSRRGADLAGDIIRSDAKVQADQDEAMVNWLADEALPRAAHAIKE